MAEVKAKAVKSVKEMSAIEGVRSAKLVKSQTSSVDIRTPNEKTLDPLVMEIIREEMGGATEHRTGLLDYLWKSNSESDYMNVTRMLNRDGSLTDAERIVHSVYGYEIAKETLQELDLDDDSDDESVDILTEAITGGFSQVSNGSQELKAAIDSGLLALKEGVNGGFQKSELASKEICNRIEGGFKNLIEAIEKNAAVLARTLEEGIHRLTNELSGDPSDEAKPSHKKK